MAEKSDIILKIKKVLAKTSNNPSPEEAQVAMLLAQKMMVENNIVMSDISAVDIHKKEVSDEVVKESTRVTWWEKNLACIIADNFKCYSYSDRQTSFIKNTNIKIEAITYVKFMGLKDDVEMAKAVYLYAVEVLTLSYKRYMKLNEDRVFKRGIKNNYIFGFLRGLEEKFAEQIKNNEWGLILVKDPDVTKAFEKFNLGDGKKINVTISNAAIDNMNGYKDGKNFQYIAGKLEEGK